MKKYNIILALLVLFILGGSKEAQKPVAQIPIMKMDDILSLSLYGNPLRHEKPRMLHMEVSKDRMVINTIIQLLNRSVKVEKSIYHGRHGYPPTIQIQLSNGDTAEIEPAVDCVTTKVNNGSETQCSPAKGELFLYKGTIEKRLISPVLYEWLQGEFKGDI